MQYCGIYGNMQWFENVSLCILCWINHSWVLSPESWVLQPWTRTIMWTSWANTSSLQLRIYFVSFSLFPCSRMTMHQPTLVEELWHGYRIRHSTTCSGPHIHQILNIIETVWGWLMKNSIWIRRRRYNSSSNVSNRTGIKLLPMTCIASVAKYLSVSICNVACVIILLNVKFWYHINKLRLIFR